MRRGMSVAGSFYPADPKEIQRYFDYFVKLSTKEPNLPDIQTRAVIVPHAGYIYSGFTASVAYRLLQKSGIKRFVVIGPSHRVAYGGSSLCDFDTYITPFGDLMGDKELFAKVQKEFELPCYAQVHAEHSTEVQFPFIKYFIPDAQIVEIVYSDEDPKNIAKIIEKVLKNKEYGVIISTDLSHFYTLEDAKKLDSICIDAIKDLEPSKLHKGCEACGMIGVEAMVLVAKKLNLQPNILDYRTSADAGGDTSRVVGYLSVAFIKLGS